MGKRVQFPKNDEWIYGLHPVLEAIRAGRRVKKIFLSSGRHEKVEALRQEAAEKGLSVETADPVFFDSRFGKGHQGVAASVVRKEPVSLEELMGWTVRTGGPALLLILDCIEDPRNLGAVLRSADAAGVHGVILQTFRSAGLGPAVVKASAGAVESVRISLVPNIKHAIRSCKEIGIAVIGAEGGSGAAPWEIDLTAPLAFVIGSEGRGLRRTVRENCDSIVSIPMKGRINSLNVSVATGVLLFEVLRQRGLGSSAGNIKTAG